MSDTVTKLTFGTRQYVLVGTAHVSSESIQEVSQVIRDERPSRVAVELDQGRFRALSEPKSWEKLDIFEIIRRRQGFLLLANLALSSFQRKIGDELEVKPGQEMLSAIQTAQELGIPYALIDREVQVTLRRAWKKSSLWGKNKLLATLVGSVFGSQDKIEKADVEALKKKNELEHMMEELAVELPAVKTVLIDERDRFLAAKLFDTEGEKIVAIVGAGHVPGMTEHLKALHAGQETSDVSDISSLPPPSLWSKIWPLLIPAAILGLIVAGILTKGIAVLGPLLLGLAVTTAGFAVLGSIVALANPVTILVAAVTAPIAALFHPLVHVFYFTGFSEATMRRPRVSDLESLTQDSASLRGFYRNRVLRILLVILLSTLGATIGMYATLPVLIKTFFN
jgi:pheromone shutdown-related protein TraB